MSPKLFESVPRSVAIIGASQQLFARGFIETLLDNGFDGNIYPIHPRETSVAGVTVLRSLDEIGQPVDLGVILLRAEACLDAAKDLASHGCRTVLIFSDGFGESNTDEGRTREAELVAWARAEDVIVIGPNGGGVADATASVIALGGLPATLRKGPVSLVSQSGAMMSGLMGGMFAEGVGIDLAIALGNASSFDLVDALETCLDRPTTGVVCAYLESLGRRVDALVNVLERLRAAGRPFLFIKPGRSELAQEVMKSHTASVAGSDAVAAAILRRHGAVRFEDPTELARGARLAIDIAPLSHERGLAVISGSGGAASLIGDLATTHGVPLSRLSDETLKQLRELTSETGHVGNPLDLSGRVVGVPPDAIFGLIARDPSVGALLMPFTTSFPDDSEGRVWHRDYLELFANAGEAEGKPVLLVALGSQSRTRWIDEFERRHAGLAVVQGLRSTMEALGALAQRSHNSDQKEATETPASAKSNTGSLPLSEAAGRALLVEADLPVVPGIELPSDAAPNQESWSFGFPVVVKGILPGVAHKAQVGGVELSICDLDALAAACARIRERSSSNGIALEGFLIQEQVSGIELLLGLVRDPDLGPAMTIGLGGALAETTSHHATAVLPLRESDLEDLVEEAGLGRLFARAHTKKSFSEYVVAIAKEFFDGRLKEWATIEINPLFLANDGRILAGDVLAIPSSV